MAVLWSRILFLLWLSSLAVSAAHAPNTAKTKTTGAGSVGWKSLSSFRHPELTAKLKDALGKQKEWSRLIKKRRMAVAVVDLHGESPRFASVNGGVMMYAASLPKIAILLAAYQSFEDGNLQETPEIHRDLSDMIRSSSNAAATRVIDQVGIKNIFNTEPPYDFGAEGFFYSFYGDPRLANYYISLKKVF